MDQPIGTTDAAPHGSGLFLRDRATKNRDAHGPRAATSGNETHSVRCDAADAAQVQESWNHTYISPKNHASSSAATPGSTLPSSNSRDAPPPVLI